MIDINRSPFFGNDIVYNENIDESLALIESADIIHIHNDINYDSFFSLTIKELKKRGTKFLRHFHSDPEMVSSITGISVDDILASDIPSTVIAQYPERYYPKARVLPNVLSINHPDYLPSTESNVHDILFSPSRRSSAWDTRWNTKGAPETIRVLKEVQKQTGCKIKVMQDRPLSEVLREKKKSGIIIDDLVTGSYHLSGLEGLSQGKVVLSYIDSRIDYVLREITGATNYPFINVRLEDAQNILINLLNEPALTEEIGIYSRKWIENYWSEEILVNHYTKIYEDLLTDPSLIKRQENLSINGTVSRYFSITLPDVIYNARAERYKLSLTMFDKIQIAVINIAGRMRSWLKNNLPEPIVRFLRYRKRINK